MLKGGNTVISKKIINWLEKMIDWYRKPKIFNFAMKHGCDVDGDVITYKGTKYVFHIMSGWIKRVN